MSYRYLKIADRVTRKQLFDLGFFYHKTTKEFWLVLNESTSYRGVEVSLVANLEKRIMKLYVTNDHKRLPDITDNKWNKDNYQDFALEMDKFSFAEVVDLSKLYNLIIDKVVYL